jgi:hypothetical protein
MTGSIELRRECAVHWRVANWRLSFLICRFSRECGLSNYGLVRHGLATKCMFRWDVVLARRVVNRLNQFFDFFHGLLAD